MKIHSNNTKLRLSVRMLAMLLLICLLLPTVLSCKKKGTDEETVATDNNSSAEEDTDMNIPKDLHSKSCSIPAALYLLRPFGSNGLYVPN